MNRSTPPPSTDKIGFKNAYMIVGKVPTCVRDYSIVIGGNRILFAGNHSAAEKNHPDCQWHDATDWLISPGLINSHTHVAMGFFRGLTHVHDHMLDQFIFPAERALTEDVMQAVSYSGIYAGLRAGITCFNDHYFFTEQIGRAFQEFGVRAYIGETLADLGGAWPNRISLDEVEAAIDRWPFAELVRPVIAPHATDTVSRDLLTRAATVAKKRGLPLHMHVSQTQSEYEKVRERENSSPVEFANQCGALFDNTLAVHLVSAKESDFETLRASGATGVVCPVSQIIYENLVPMDLFTKLGSQMSFATDCAASNDHFNMLSEAKSLALLARLSGIEKDYFSASKLFSMMTSAPAKALGMEGKLGTIDAGAKADLIFVKCDLGMQPMNRGLENLIFSAETSNIRHVMIDGRWVLWNDEPTLVNLADKTREYNESVQTIYQRAGIKV